MHRNRLVLGLIRPLLSCTSEHVLINSCELLQEHPQLFHYVLSHRDFRRVGATNKMEIRSDNVDGRLGSTTSVNAKARDYDCLLYTSPSPRDGLLSRMPSSA